MGTPRAVDRLGRVVPTPPYVAPEVWARFVGAVVMVPGGCHLWTGPPRDDGYGQFWAPVGAILPAPAGSVVLPALAVTGAPGGGPAEAVTYPRRPRVWRAHRFAYAAWYGPVLDVEQLMHQCDEPLCVPVTAHKLDEHLVAGDNRANVAEREARHRGVRRGRYGLPVWSRADRRGQAARSLALHRALTDALAAGAAAEDLPGVVAAVNAGAALAEQLPLPLPSPGHQNRHQTRYSENPEPAR